MKPQARYSSDAGGSVLNRAINAAEVAANKASKASFADTATCAITRASAVGSRGVQRMTRHLFLAPNVDQERLSHA